MAIAIPGLTWTLKLLGLWNTGRANATRLTLHEREWHVPGLPLGLEGFTILHLSDLHYPRRHDGFAEAVEALVDGVEADLCVITGDYRYGHLGPTDHVPGRMEALLARFRSRFGAWGVLGNHDTASMIDPLRGAGLNLLVNEGAEIDVNGVRIWLAGCDDPHTMKAHDLGAAMHGANEDHFVIALVHTPELIVEAEAAGARLYFCGHTHGGQVRVPYWGPIETNCRVAPRFIHGEWRHGNMLGITTAGLGTTDVPVRINCPAEAHRITLRAG
jgi:predicted MPP superfamily phosphohydrolase